MALLTIRVFPDDVLKRKAEPVASVDDDVRRLLADMAETMYARHGIGLAAPQVGISRRVVVIDVPADEDEAAKGSGLLYLVNPAIATREGSTTTTEGCLSFPGLEIDVKRAARVRVTHLDDRGEARELAADGLLAICLQHELDHLDGIVFTDRLGPVSRRLALREFDKLRREASAEP
jgi:peptide deformylase